jgi:hypothetical protein
LHCRKISFRHTETNLIAPRKGMIGTTTTQIVKICACHSQLHKNYRARAKVWNQTWKVYIITESVIFENKRLQSFILRRAPYVSSPVDSAAPCP